MKKIFTLICTILIAFGASASNTAPIVKTCAEAAAIAATLEHNIPTEETYSITGYVTYTDGKISLGQQVFWMDDVKGENQTFYAYWCNLPDGETALKVGDKVTIVGNILKYGTKGEMKMVDVNIIERAPASGPTVDETGITVNGRKYGFPVRLVKEVK